MEKFSIKKFHYDEEYSEQLRFVCDYCGAKAGQICITISQQICEPHANRWNKMRELPTANLKRSLKRKTNVEKPNGIQEWLRG